MPSGALMERGAPPRANWAWRTAAAVPAWASWGMMSLGGLIHGVMWGSEGSTRMISLPIEAVSPLPRPGVAWP